MPYQRSPSSGPQPPFWKALFFILCNWLMFFLQGLAGSLAFVLLRFGLLLQFPDLTPDGPIWCNKTPTVKTAAGCRQDQLSYGTYYYNVYTIIWLYIGVVHLSTSAFLPISASVAPSSSMTTIQPTEKIGGLFSSATTTFINRIGGRRNAVCFPIMLGLHIFLRWATEYDSVNFEEQWYVNYYEQTVVFLFFVSVALYHPNWRWHLSRLPLMILPVVALELLAFAEWAMFEWFIGLFYDSLTSFFLNIMEKVMQAGLAAILGVVSVIFLELLQRTIASGQTDTSRTHVLILFTLVFLQFVNIPAVALLSSAPFSTMGWNALFGALAQILQDRFGRSSSTASSKTIVGKRMILPKKTSTAPTTASAEDTGGKTAAVVESTKEKKRSKALLSAVDQLYLQHQMIVLNISASAFSLGFTFSGYTAVRLVGIFITFGSCFDSDSIAPNRLFLFPFLSVFVITVLQVSYYLWWKPDFYTIWTDQIKDRRVARELFLITLVWLPHLMLSVSSTIGLGLDRSICVKKDSEWYQAFVQEGLREKGQNVTVVQ